MAAPPLVSCILTVFNYHRLTLARKAVNNFIRQHYVPYELIIVNSTGQAVLTNNEMERDDIKAAGCHIREVPVDGLLNSATMKNIGLDQAKGDWIICIDDDDYFHPSRLLYQMAHRVEHAPCLLRYQLRIDISSAVRPFSEDAPKDQTIRPLLHLLKMDSGVPCTMLFPRINEAKKAWKFNEDLNTGEYEELLARMQNMNDPVVCDNMHNVFVKGLHWPIMSVAIYHGNNELTYERFFAKYDPLLEANGVPIGLNVEDIEHLKVVLQSYNFRVS